MKKSNIFIALSLTLLLSVGVAFATDEQGGATYGATVNGNYNSFLVHGDYDSKVVGGAGAEAGALGIAGAKNMNYGDAGTYQSPYWVKGHYENQIVGYTLGGSDIVNLNNGNDKKEGRGYWKNNSTGDISWYGPNPPTDLIPGSTIHSTQQGLPIDQNGWTYLGRTPTPVYEQVFVKGHWETKTVQLPSFQAGKTIVMLNPQAGAFAFDNGLEAGSVAFSKIEGNALACGIVFGPGGDKEWSSSKTFVGGVVFQQGYVMLENDNAYAGSMNKSGAVFFTSDWDFDKGNGAAKSNSNSNGGAFTAGFNYSKINNDAVNPSAFNITGNHSYVNGNPEFSKVYGSGISQTGVQVAGVGQASGLSSFSYQHPTSGYGIASSWSNITQNGGTVTATSGGWSIAGTGVSKSVPVAK